MLKKPRVPLAWEKQVCKKNPPPHNVKTKVNHSNKDWEPTRNHHKIPFSQLVRWPHSDHLFARGLWTLRTNKWLLPVEPVNGMWTRSMLTKENRTTCSAETKYCRARVRSFKPMAQRARTRRILAWTSLYHAIYRLSDCNSIAYLGVSAVSR